MALLSREALVFVSCLVFFKTNKFISPKCEHEIPCKSFPQHVNFSFMSLLKTSFHCQILLLYFHAVLNSALQN